MTSKTAASPAFSLVEVIMTLAIIGIIAAIAVPRWAGYLTEYRVSQAARQIAQDIDRARASAYTTSRARRIDFDMDQHAYQITEAGGPSSSLNHRIVLAAAPFHAQLITVNFAGQRHLEFSGYGQAATGGTVTIGVGAARRTINIEAPSGKVTVQ